MKEGRNIKSSIMYAVIAVIVALGVGFLGGMNYQKTSTLSRGNRQFMVGAGNRAVGGAGARMGFRPIAGEVIVSDASTVTVKLQDGSSKIIIVSDKTIMTKEETAIRSDIVIGTKIAVSGTENQDGSVTAQAIQINPTFRFDTNRTQGK